MAETEARASANNNRELFHFEFSVEFVPLPNSLAPYIGLFNLQFEL